MQQIIRLLILLPIAAACILVGAQGVEQNDCVAQLKKVGAEGWCTSVARSSCLKSEGVGATEWCDASAYVAAEHKRADAQLNDTYRKVLTGLEDHQRTLLRESQRKWLQYQIAECEARTSLLNGAVAIMRNNIRQSCINDFTEQRTTELRKEFCGVGAPCR